MRRSSKKIHHSPAFSARLEALNALRCDPAQANVARLHAAADRLRKVAEEFGDAPSASVYAGFAELTHLVGLLYDWRAAVRSAGMDAQRFLTAAQARATEWLAAYGDAVPMVEMKGVAEQIVAASTLSEVPLIARCLVGIPIPVGIYMQPKLDSLSLREQMGFGPFLKVDEKERPIDLAVAFITFTIDGRPLVDIHYVRPGEAHDMDIEVRVSRWPQGATHLVLEPMTVEAPGTYELPVFKLNAPLGEAGPFRLNARGRVVLKVPQHFGTRPFEFKYTARFTPSDTEQPVEVAGQRTLSLEGLDMTRNPITGYNAVDNALVELRNMLRTRPHLLQQELSDALTVAGTLGNLAGQAVQDNFFPYVISEGEFQRIVRMHLRANPHIGAELEEHAQAAGGITDLSFHGVRIELKVEKEKRLVLKDCTRYTGQAASYTVGSGKHIGLLCVLDCSPKTQSAFPAEDGIGIYPVQEKDGSPVYVIIVLLQGNLVKPSSLSR